MSANRDRGGPYSGGGTPEASPGLSNALNIREICRHRILNEMLQRVYSEEGYVVLIADRAALRVLSACCRLHDVLEAGVTVVEDLDKKRQPLSQLDGVYFISSDITSVEKVQQDFAHAKKSQYRAAHLFFTGPLLMNKEARIMDRIAADAALLSRIKTFTEFNLDFIAHEQRLCHFDYPEAFVDFFGASLQGDRIHEVANKLCSVCLSVGKVDYIRYLRPNLSSPDSDQSSTWCEQLAEIIYARLLPGSNGAETEDGNSKESRGGKGGTGGAVTTHLIILDRSIDTASLLVHEYTYQAMVYDVLDIPLSGTKHLRDVKGADPSLHDDNMTTAHRGASGTDAQRDGELGLTPQAAALAKYQDDAFQYEYTDNQGKTGMKTAILGEHDDLWVRFRHEHVSIVNDTVTEEVRAFARESAAAKLHNRDAAGAMSTDATAAAVRQLPQYQELLSKYWAHCSLSERCFSELENRHLMKIGGPEQDLATGVDKDGSAINPSKLLSALGSLLSEAIVGSEEKLRLLLLYFTQMAGVGEEDRAKMIRAASLSEEETEVCNSFLKMKLHNSRVKESRSENPMPPRGQSKHTHRQDAARLKFFKQRAKAVNFELSRFECAFKDIARKAISGELDRSAFPFIHEPPKESKSQVSGRSGKSKATASGAAGGTQWDWGWKQGGAADAEGLPARKAVDALRKPRNRFIFFILGGATLSEVRSCYELSDELQVECLMASTSLLSFRWVYNLLNRRPGRTAP